MVWFLSTPDRSANPAQHHRRQIISCDCRTCMKQSSYQHHSINLFAIFQETKNIFIYQILPISLIFLLVLEATVAYATLICTFYYYYYYYLSTETTPDSQSTHPIHC